MLVPVPVVVQGDRIKHPSTVPVDFLVNGVKEVVLNVVNVQEDLSTPTVTVNVSRCRTYSRNVNEGAQITDNSRAPRVWTANLVLPLGVFFKVQGNSVAGIKVIDRVPNHIVPSSFNDVRIEDDVDVPLTGQGRPSVGNVFYIPNVVGDSIQVRGVSDHILFNLSKLVELSFKIDN